MADIILKGISVSLGIGIGTVGFMNTKALALPHSLIPHTAVESEVARLQAAVQKVIDHYESTLNNLPEHLQEHGDIIDSHLLICNDKKLLGEAERLIRTQLYCAEWALEESINLIKALFQQINAPYIRERMQDVRIVGEAISKALLSIADALIPDACILFANDIGAADILGLASKNIAGVITAEGGSPAHTGIITRGLGIPAIVGVGGFPAVVEPGDLIILDGFSGQILIRPSEVDLEKARIKEQEYTTFKNACLHNAHYPAESVDGERIRVFANIDVFSDSSLVHDNGGEGIGLVRTEMGFLSRRELPTEEELFIDYHAIVQAMAPHEVTFRTIDFGADKQFGAMPIFEEANPALGLRSTRFSLHHQHLFKTQLRALVRASAFGKISIMFPLIGSVKELKAALSLLHEAKQEVANEGYAFADIAVGTMVELPSAVIIADSLVKLVDFFSIGTNDLIQFTLGVDRDNKRVAHLYRSLHPAIIRSIKHVADIANAAGVPVSVCGEMAADPYCIPLLLAMPIDTLSVSPRDIPLIKYIIRNCSLQQCRKILGDALMARDADVNQRMMYEYAYHAYPQTIPFLGSVPTGNIL